MDVAITREGFGIFTEVALAMRLREHNLHPASIGTVPHSRSQSKILGPPFLLSKEQLQYLYELGLIQYSPGVDQTLEYRCFKQFTQAGYYLKDGLKFGCRYIAYPKDPLITHSKYMIVLGSLSARRLLELGRIAGHSRKKLVVADFEQVPEQAQPRLVTKEITWIPSLAREKPLPRK